MSDTSVTSDQFNEVLDRLEKLNEVLARIEKLEHKVDSLRTEMHNKFEYISAEISFGIKSCHQ